MRPGGRKERKKRAERGPSEMVVKEVRPGGCGIPLEGKKRKKEKGGEGKTARKFPIANKPEGRA